MAQVALSLPQDISSNAFSNIDFMSESPKGPSAGNSGMSTSKSMGDIASVSSRPHSQRVPVPQQPSSMPGMSQPPRSVASLGMGPPLSMPPHLQFPFLTPSPQLMYPPGTSIHPNANGIPASQSFFPQVTPQSAAEWQMAMQAAALQQQQQSWPQQGVSSPAPSPAPYYHNQPIPYPMMHPQMQGPPISHPQQHPQYHQRTNSSASSSISFPAQQINDSQSPKLETASYGGGPIRSQQHKRTESGSSLPSASLRRAAAGSVPSPQAHPGMPYPPRLRTESSTSDQSSLSSRERKPSSIDNSERSITPTPATHGVAKSSASSRSASPVPRNTHSPGPSVSNMSRPSPLGRPEESGSEGRPSEDRGIGYTMEKKSGGFGKIKKAFSMSTLSNPGMKSSRGHEKGRPSNDSSSSSLSAASTPPPGTPPDGQAAAPRVFSHLDHNSSTSTLPSQKGHGPPPTGKNRLGMLSKMNSSTDNISISSTVSSASMMIRKIGTLGGRLNKRGSLGSIGSMFSKDKDRDNDAASEMGVPGSAKEGKLKKKDKKKAALAAAHVAHVTIEQEQAPEKSGMTPAAALAQRHQQRFAEQEAAAAEAAAKTEQEAKQREVDRQKTDDKRLRGIEKEKEKLKGRKQKKWGMGSFSGSNSFGTASSTTSVDRNAIVGEFGESVRDDASSINEQFFQDNASTCDDRTPRASVDLDTTVQQLEQLSAPPERLESYFDDDVSFRGSASGFNTPRSIHDGSESEYEGSLYRGKQNYHSEPMRSFRPVKGILKSSPSFHQEFHLQQPDRPFARIRSNSYDVPGKQSGSARPVNHTRSSSAQDLTQLAPSPRGHPVDYTASPTEMSRSSSPQTQSNNKGPYLNASLNVSAPVLNTMTAPPMAMRSATGGPMPSKKLSFAQNLSVHTTWPPNVYDRRGEQATCNKLTPALAQRIKEELNAYKLNEMNVHQTSRVYTHFFA